MANEPAVSESLWLRDRLSVCHTAINGPWAPALLAADGTTDLSFAHSHLLAFD